MEFIMTEHVLTRVANGVGTITLDRPKTLNSLSLEMVRALTAILRDWHDDAAVAAVVLRSSSEKALCAGGDIRFFHEVGHAGVQGGSALLEDFFTEEYALNHLIHFYPKPYIALMDGVVMGGGMGIAQGGPDCGLRIVTERTKMAMPEVNIGLFPDVGGSHFLSHAPGQLGMYLGLSGLTIGAADALYIGLADLFVPAEQLPALGALIDATPGAALPAAIRAFAAPFADHVGASELQAQRAPVDAHFGAGSVAAIMASLEGDDTPFAQKALKAMRQRSPLLMCVTHELLKRGAMLGVADCLRLERSLVRRNFEHGEVLEGVRALVIDKDNAPQWNPPALDDVTPEMVARFFEPVWPDYAHPLRQLA
jgi:enoyl-CoA hydratase/carnithine racemase